MKRKLDLVGIVNNIARNWPVVLAPGEAERLAALIGDGRPVRIARHKVARSGAVIQSSQGEWSLLVDHGNIVREDLRFHVCQIETAPVPIP